LATITHRFKRRIDLAERGRGRAGIPAPLGKEHQRDAFVASSRGPLEQPTLAGPFLERLTIGGDGLVELWLTSCKDTPDDDGETSPGSLDTMLQSEA